MMASSLFKKSAKLFNDLRKNTNLIRTVATYKAAVVHDSLNTFTIEEKQRSPLGDTQVRVQVHYCSVNSNDLPTFHGKSKKVSTPGYEFGGEVIELGKKLAKNRLILGEKVVALSLDEMGGFAEECVLNVEDVFRLPSNVGLKEATILICGHSLALLAFSKMAQLQKDDYVIISAGTAGLGLAAVDVAANVYGAKVIGVVDTSDKAELLRKRGAFKTVISDSKLHQHVLSALGKHQAKIVYDAVGNNVHEMISKCASSGGQIFLAGPHLYKGIPPPPPNTSLTVLDLSTVKKHSLEAFRNTVTDVLDLADQRLISAHISASFSLADINQAIEYIEQNKSTGKVLIKIL